MDNIKKLGLTALAGSMVATAAQSAELSASGSWALSYTSEDDDEDDEEEANVEKEAMGSNKNITKKQVKDAKELASVQEQMVNNLKAMTPLIKQVEGFADKYKSSLNNDKLDKLVKAMDQMGNEKKNKK